MAVAVKSGPLLLVFIIATAWTTILVRPGRAQPEPEPAEPAESLSLPLPAAPATPTLLSSQRLPSLLPPVNVRGSRLLSGPECWTGLRGIKGCIWQIYDFLFAGERNQIGKECCWAFLAITEDCWPKMFPQEPLYGPSIRGQCDAIIGKP